MDWDAVDNDYRRPYWVACEIPIATIATIPTALPASTQATGLQFRRYTRQLRWKITQTGRMARWAGA